MQSIISRISILSVWYISSKVFQVTAAPELTKRSHDHVYKFCSIIDVPFVSSRLSSQTFELKSDQQLLELTHNDSVAHHPAIPILLHGSEPQCRLGLGLIVLRNILAFHSIGYILEDRHAENPL